MSERSFHVLVVAPLRARDDHATDSAWREPVRFERASFDEAMASVAPSLVVDVPDPSGAPGAKPVRVPLVFKAMRSFRPDALLAEVPFLAALRDPAAVPAAKPIGRSLVDDILSSMTEEDTSASPAPSVDRALASVLGHPEVRRLEAAWRGLHLLASRTDRASIVVSAIAAHEDEVDLALERIARDPGRASIDLLVVDHALGSSRRDLDRLEAWASRAEAIGAPLVANGLAELVGQESVGKLGASEGRLRSSDDPRAVAFRAVASRDASRWIALALNGAVARPRHEGAVARHEGVRLDERNDLFVGPAYLVAVLAAASFTRTGWATSFVGPTHGALRDLPVHAVSDRGTTVMLPLEALVNEDAAAEAAAAGLSVLQAAPNADSAFLTHARMVYRGPAPSGGAAPPAMLHLGDQLFVARLAQAVIQLAGAIPSGTPEPAVRDVARLTLAELFGEAARLPEIDLAIVGAPPCLEVTVRPRGFQGVKLEEITLGAPLG